MPGEIVPLETPASDTAKAREFWGGLLEREFESYPGPNEYYMTRLAETQGAAIGTADSSKGMRPYFDVDDINAGVARVRELGGSADEAMAVPSMGWFATCTDPNGIEFGLWQTDPSASAD